MEDLNRIMVLKGGSLAIHKLGDIGRKDDEFIRVDKETDKYYVGMFEEGFGFINVKFKKEDVRPLTQNEVDDLNSKWYTINGNPIVKIKTDKDGYIIPSKKKN